MSAWIVFLQSVVGAALVVAAAAKAFSRTSVAEFLLGLGLPRRPVEVVSPLVPVVEAALGVSLLAGVARPALAVASALLCFGFFAAQLRAYARGATEGCRCYGSLDSETGAGVGLVRASVLLAVATAAAILLSTGDRGDLGFAAERWPTFAGAAVAVGAILVSALLSEVAGFYARASAPGARP
jgi:hypothetical protein